MAVLPRPLANAVLKSGFAKRVVAARVAFEGSAALTIPVRIKML